MPSELREPGKRPKERIERLLESQADNRDRRVHDRIIVEPGAEVFFPLICKGEIVDVSDEGIAVRFKPSDAVGLVEGEILQITIPLENHSFKLPAKVKRVESRFGVFVVGMNFDSEDIEIIE